MPQRIPLPQFSNPLIRMNGRCPTCNTPYDFQRLRILAEKDQAVLAFLECGQCATSVLSLLHVGPNGLASHLLVTDLTADEVESRLDRDQAVTGDQLIDLHQYLEANSFIGVFLNEPNP
jgi:hypothetical protein